jgi:uncharacterized protein YkwD
MKSLIGKCLLASVGLVFLLTGSRLFGMDADEPVILNQGVKTPGFLSPLETEVVVELNRARTTPREFADSLREMKLSFTDKFSFKRGGQSILTREGVAAVDEAIAFLEEVAPQPPLCVSRGISLAARDHARDQALHGGLGHEGADKSLPLERMNRYGSVDLAAGENVDYGNQRARDVVIQLIVDDGVPGRGHRLAIFNPRYRVVGVSCGSHPDYTWMCVIDYAGAYEEKRAKK